MSIKINNTYHGFTVVSIEYIEEIHSMSYLLEHKKSGARLFYIENEDRNKVFSIAFRTPSQDNTGVAHILEHSVLCGSRKFPLKEPFVELVKGSMNTFLNAMTFSDKTMYPIASMNDKDFQNLMDVYLDAVFFPKIYDNKYILKQEGWHYSTTDDNNLIYKGVVYNEMKGVYSSPETILEQESMAALFPDTSYRFESGGHPDFITDLTESDFEQFHSKYYHPSNSYLYLYGKMDVEKYLEFIDREYLKHFEVIKVDSKIKVQSHLPKTVISRSQYPLTEGEDADNRSFLSLSMVVGEPCDIEKYIALNILDSVLVNMPGAPLKQAILDARIAQDVESSLNTSLRQNVFSITASGTNASCENDFIDIIYKTLNELVHQGLDKELLESALNIMEFKLREADFGAYPKGLIYGIRSMDTWLYDYSPVMALKYNDVIKKMRENIKGRYFESFIETYLLDNTHRALVVLEPQIGLEMERNALLTAKLAEVKSNFTKEEFVNIVDQMQHLQDMQSHIDSPEDLEKIPLLSIGDIEADIIPNDYKVFKEDEVEYLYQPSTTNKIIYLQGRLNANNIPENMQSYYYLFVDLLKEFSTDKYSYFELAKKISLYSGGISFSTNLNVSEHNADEFSSNLAFSAKCLRENLDETLDLVSEILQSTNFNDEKRLYETINEIKTDIENSISSNGHSVALSRLDSHISSSGAFAEKGSLEYFYFIKDLSSDFGNKFKIIIKKLQEISNYVVNKKDMLIGISCEEYEYQSVLASVKKFANNLPLKERTTNHYSIEPVKKNEGIYTSGMVQYVAMGGDFKKLGFEYNASLRVVETLLKYEYLWTNIRVKGGAYGMMLQIHRNGILKLVSYRDPNLKNTVNVYKGIGEYLQELTLSDREVLKYIIGTMSKIDMPLYDSAKLVRSISYHLLGVTDDERQKTRNEILGTSLQDINGMADLFKAVIDTNNICVVGSEKAIKENSDLFDDVFSGLVGPGNI